MGLLGSLRRRRDEGPGDGSGMSPGQAAAAAATMVEDPLCPQMRWGVGGRAPGGRACEKMPFNSLRPCPSLCANHSTLVFSRGSHTLVESNEQN